MDENASAYVSDAAKVLADSLGDWLRELLTSDNEGVQTNISQTPVTVIAQHQSNVGGRISSSSSDYFVPRIRVSS